MPLTEQPKKPRKKLRKPLPVCPVHDFEMEVRCTRGDVRYCYCPVNGCPEAAKQLREPDGD